MTDLLQKDRLSYYLRQIDQDTIISARLINKIFGKRQVKDLLIYYFGKGDKNRIEYYLIDDVSNLIYQMRTSKGIKYRQLYTKILSEFMRKGFAMDDERLKHG